MVAEDLRNWDLMIQYMLFNIHEIPQGSTGFTPFKLLFGRQPHGILDVASQASHSPSQAVIEHVRDKWEKMDRVMPLYANTPLKSSVPRKDCLIGPTHPVNSILATRYGTGPHHNFKVSGHLEGSLTGPQMS